MPFDLESDDDIAQRNLQRLENRYARSRVVLARAQAAYVSLWEKPGASPLQCNEALQRVERARRHLAELHNSLELAEEQMNVA